jgi:hypothetical protein
MLKAGSDDNSSVVLPAEVSFFLAAAHRSPNSFAFSSVMDMIKKHFDQREVKWSNGETTNDAGQNAGAAAVYSLAAMAGLDEKRALELFAEHYRDVLNTPEANDHANIRNFMVHGWKGIDFMEGYSLVPKQ